jgi:hypothetical protein
VIDWKKTTKFFVVFLVLAIGVYDLVALYFGGNAATISRLAPTLPPATIFALGFAFGHMFWIQTFKK